jgi:hypothetical protein
VTLVLALWATKFISGIAGFLVFVYDVTSGTIETFRKQHPFPILSGKSAEAPTQLGRLVGITLNYCT